MQLQHYLQSWYEVVRYLSDSCIVKSSVSVMCLVEQPTPQNLPTLLIIVLTTMTFSSESKLIVSRITNEMKLSDAKFSEALERMEAKFHASINAKNLEISQLRDEVSVLKRWKLIWMTMTRTNEGTL